MRNWSFCFWIKEARSFSIGGERMEVSSGDVVIIQPNIPHSAFRKDPGEIVFYAITVHFSFLSSLENDRIQQKYVLPIFLQNQKYPYHITPSMDKNQQILSRLQTIKETYIYEKPGYELLIKSQLFEIFYLLEQYVYENNKKQCNQQMKFCHNSSTVKIILAYIQKNYKNRITLKDMADHLNMNTAYFCRLFHKNFGIPPIEFLNRYRVSEAIRLIEMTEKRITDISYITGFPNVNRFLDTFKKNIRQDAYAISQKFTSFRQRRESIRS